MVLSTSGPNGLETNQLYYKGTEETQRFEQVGAQQHAQTESGVDGSLARHVNTRACQSPDVNSQDWEHSKRRQDAQLERVERGVGTLADMARSMQVWGQETAHLEAAAGGLVRVRVSLSYAGLRPIALPCLLHGAGGA